MLNEVEASTQVMKNPLKRAVPFDGAEPFLLICTFL